MVIEIIIRTKQNSGAKEYSERIETWSREYQQQKGSIRRNNL